MDRAYPRRMWKYATGIECQHVCLCRFPNCVLCVQRWINWTYSPLYLVGVGLLFCEYFEMLLNWFIICFGSIFVDCPRVCLNEIKMVYQVGTMDKYCDNSGIWDDVNSYICCHLIIHKCWAPRMIMLQQKTIFISLTVIFIQRNHIFSLGYSTSNMTDSLQSWTQSSI